MKKDNHEEVRSFLETGIGGSYEFSNPTVSRTQLGKMFPYFDDVEITVDSEGLKINRKMCIDGKVFHVCSIFPMMGKVKKTPTEQLIKYIDKITKNKVPKGIDFRQMIGCIGSTVSVCRKERRSR